MLLFPRVLNILKNVRKKSDFVARMSEALDKFEQEEALRKVQRSCDAEKLKKTKDMKRNLKKRKWVEWDAQDEKSKAEAAAKKATFDPADRIKRKKCAILLGYCGANYFGMQRNPGMQTIEEELLKAMVKHKWINEDGFEQAQNVAFQRAARTDKGVSAARQVCSIKLPEELDLKALNADLPEQIRIFATQRVTKGFNAKDQCNARSYTYTLPSIAFAECHTGDVDGWQQLLASYDSFRLDAVQLEKVRDTLKLYEGTKNFHNFTSKKLFIDPSAKRYIMSFTASEPFVSPQSVEFITVKVKGQSFMLHQIRKMVALVIAIVRGNTTVATMQRALTEERLDLPMAPGLGLVLDQVHYERYDERYGKDGIHEPLTWVQQDAEVNAFIERYIYANIYETEHKERPMMAWLETLAYHSYDRRTDDEQSEQKSKKTSDDDNDE